MMADPNAFQLKPTMDEGPQEKGPGLALVRRSAA